MCVSVLHNFETLYDICNEQCTLVICAKLKMSYLICVTSDASDGLNYYYCDLEKQKQKVICVVSVNYIKYRSINISVVKLMYCLLPGEFIFCSLVMSGKNKIFQCSMKSCTLQWNPQIINAVHNVKSSS